MPFLYDLKLAIPFFYDAILLTLFAVIAIGGYFAQKDLGNKNRIVASFTVAGFVSTILSVFLAMANLVSAGSLILYSGLTILGFTLLFLYK